MNRVHACAIAFAFVFAGCIRAPEIVLVDRATALEQQASGSFPELEKKLARAGLQPRPVPLTPQQLDALGMPPPALFNHTELTDADRVDELLAHHCLGESTDGTLADTHEACRGAADHEQALTLADRVNTARQQLWRWMKEKKRGVTLDEARGAWRRQHLLGLPCGAWLQRDDGAWEAKKCG